MFSGSEDIIKELDSTSVMQELKSVGVDLTLAMPLFAYIVKADADKREKQKKSVRRRLSSTVEEKHPTIEDSHTDQWKKKYRECMILAGFDENYEIPPYPILTDEQIKIITTVDYASDEDKARELSKKIYYTSDPNDHNVTWFKIMAQNYGLNDIEMLVDTPEKAIIAEHIVHQMENAKQKTAQECFLNEYRPFTQVFTGEIEPHELRELMSQFTLEALAFEDQEETESKIIAPVQAALPLEEKIESKDEMYQRYIGYLKSAKFATHELPEHITFDDKLIEEIHAIQELKDNSDENDADAGIVLEEKIVESYYKFSHLMNDVARFKALAKALKINSPAIKIDSEPKKLLASIIYSQHRNEKTDQAQVAYIIKTAYIPLFNYHMLEKLKSMIVEEREDIIDILDFFADNTGQLLAKKLIFQFASTYLGLTFDKIHQEHQDKIKLKTQAKAKPQVVQAYDQTITKKIETLGTQLVDLQTKITRHETNNRNFFQQMNDALQENKVVLKTKSGDITVLTQFNASETILEQKSNAETLASSLPLADSTQTKKIPTLSSPKPLISPSIEPKSDTDVKEDLVPSPPRTFAPRPSPLAQLLKDRLEQPQTELKNSTSLQDEIDDTYVIEQAIWLTEELESLKQNIIQQVLTKNQPSIASSAREFIREISHIVTFHKNKIMEIKINDTSKLSDLASYEKSKPVEILAAKFAILRRLHQFDPSKTFDANTLTLTQCESLLASYLEIAKKNQQLQNPLDLSIQTTLNQLTAIPYQNTQKLIAFIKEQLTKIKSENQDRIPQLFKRNKYKLTLSGIVPVDNGHKELNNKTQLSFAQQQIIRDNAIVFFISRLTDKNIAAQIFSYYISNCLPTTELKEIFDKKALLNYISDTQEAKKRVLYFLNGIFPTTEIPDMIPNRRITLFRAPTIDARQPETTSSLFLSRQAC